MGLVIVIDLKPRNVVVETVVPLACVCICETTIGIVRHEIGVVLGDLTHVTEGVRSCDISFVLPCLRRVPLLPPKVPAAISCRPSLHPCRHRAKLKD